MRKYTLSEIRAINKEKGFSFFNRQTMKFFGETMKHWRVFYRGEKIFIERYKPNKTSLAGKICSFNPETGEIRTYNES